MVDPLLRKQRDLESARAFIQHARLILAWSFGTLVGRLILLATG